MIAASLCVVGRVLLLVLLYIILTSSNLCGDKKNWNALQDNFFIYLILCNVSASTILPIAFGYVPMNIYLST